MKNKQVVWAIIAVVVFVLLVFTYEQLNVIDEQAASWLFGNKLLQTIGEYGTEIIIAFLIGVILALIVKRNIRLLAYIALAIGAELVMNKLLKNGIGRIRPETASDIASYSFPSGHTMFSFVALMLVAYAITRYVAGRGRIVIWSVAVIFAVLMGISRVATGHHFLTDVVAGWALAYAIVAGMMFLEQQK